MTYSQSSLTDAVSAIERRIRLPDETTSRPVLIVMTGLPGTGKSYVSRRIFEAIPSVIVQSDFVRKTLYPRPSYTSDESNFVYQTCHSLILSLLQKGYRVIFDATNLIERNRELLYQIAERARAVVIVVRTWAPRDVIIERFDHRRQGLDVEDLSDADLTIYERMKSEEQKIQRKHIVIDTSKDIEPAIQRIVRSAVRR
jgi:predicted kinase